MAKKPENKKEIIELSEKEHIRLRSTMYLGQIDASEEKIPIINLETKKLQMQQKMYSVAFYKLFDEIFSNALDEARRLKGKMPLIEVKINSETNQVDIIDSGEGFYKAIEVNSVSGITNIEAAVSRLRAGSNFFNDDKDMLIGTNGMGAALVNIMSDKFEIESRNDSSYFFRRWIDYEPEEVKIEKKKQTITGTRVSFIPLKATFKKDKWDKQMIWTYLILKKWIVQNIEKEVPNLAIKCYFDGNLLDLNIDPFPTDRLEVTTKIGKVMFWIKKDNTPYFGSINGAIGGGVYEKMINDWINTKVEFQTAHHYFDTVIALQLPATLMRFVDQNKTRLATTRGELEPLFEEAVYPKLNRFFPGSDFEKKLKKVVEEAQKEQAIKKIKVEKKNTKIKFSSKYLPSAKNANIFLVEGDSAAGSLAQRRDSDTDAIYALTGKIKNCNTLMDIASSKNIIELLHVLDLDIENPTKKPLFQKIIIATDGDVDGGHISALLLHLFAKWFPSLFEKGIIHKLQSPLVSVETSKGREYFYYMKDYEFWAQSNKGTNVRYLKGLGSLDVEKDWEYVMQKQRVLFQYKHDRSATRMLDMAFGDSAQARKIWLAN